MKRFGHRKLFITFLILAFLFRLGFGLCSQFWAEDEKYTYMNGLKFYATGEWPYYGPYVTDRIQIPGALQGLSIGLPFFLLPIPEAPFILLNILSFASLCLLAWYCAKRLPEIPAWFLWPWLMIAPWTLNFSTHVVNPSYVLPGSIVFFVAFIETYPPLSKSLIPAKQANFMMGAALFWVMQFHMSWVILVPFTLASFYFQLRRRGVKSLHSLFFFILGAALSGAFILPTFVKYGFTEGLGGTGGTVGLNLTNLTRHLNPVEGILGRFLSFASFEMPRFIGSNTARRLAFFKAEPWLVPFGLFLLAVGLLQPLVMIVMGFSKSHPRDDWKQIKYLTLFTVLLLYIMFLFTFRTPDSHTYYITFPIIMLYSMYCWSKLLENSGWRKIAKGIIVSGIVFQAGFALHNYGRVSLYVNRSVPRSAVEMKDYRILGERRPQGRY